MRSFRVFCAIAVSVLIFSVSAVFVSAGSGYVLGDADGDEAVTVLDVTTIQRHLSEMPVKYIDEVAADVNGSGLDISDATFIQRSLADIEVPFDIGGYVNPSPTEIVPSTNPRQTDNYELPFVPVK